MRPYIYVLEVQLDIGAPCKICCRRWFPTLKVSLNKPELVKFKNDLKRMSKKYARNTGLYAKHKSRVPADYHVARYVRERE